MTVHKSPGCPSPHIHHDSRSPKNDTKNHRASSSHEKSDKKHLSEMGYNEDGDRKLVKIAESAKPPIPESSQYNEPMIGQEIFSTASRSSPSIISPHSNTSNQDEPQKDDSQALQHDTLICQPKVIAKPSVTGCRTLSDFEFVTKVGDGTYGIVSKIKEKATGHIYAMKMIKQDDAQDGFPLSSLREIKTLMLFPHDNIVHLKEIVVSQGGESTYLIMEYLEHDLQGLMQAREKSWTIAEAKCLLKQLLTGVKHLHEHWAIHRDIKPANLLMNNMGVLKIGDFGLAREYGSPLQPMTPGVVTLWYRAPEIILANEYTPAIDIWACGCVFAELVSNRPLFSSVNDLHLINKIYKVLGTPNDRIWPGYSNLKRVKEYGFISNPYSTLKSRFPQLSKLGYDLLKLMLLYDPNRRITAEKALEHPYFEESPAPTDPSFMPTHKSRVDGKIQKYDRSIHPSYQEKGTLGEFDPPEDEYGSFITNNNAKVERQG